MKFRISRRARSQIERIQAWWVENRPASPALFIDELAAAERRLRAAPELGAVYAEQKGGVVRRVVLPKTHHHLYYRIAADGTELTVLIVWVSVIAKMRGGSVKAAASRSVPFTVHRRELGRSHDFVGDLQIPGAEGTVAVERVGSMNGRASPSPFAVCLAMLSHGGHEIGHDTSEPLE